MIERQAPERVCRFEIRPLLAIDSGCRNASSNRGLVPPPTAMAEWNEAVRKLYSLPFARMEN